MDFTNVDALAFWAIALAMTAAALGFVVPRLFAGRAPPAAASPAVAAANVAVYRSQLADLERDLAAGTLTDAEYRQSCRDLERRLLAEAQDAAPASAARPARATWGAAVAIGLALPALAFGLYAIFGNPAAITHHAAATASPDLSTAVTPAVLRAQLVTHLARTPGDGRSWVLLARLDFAADRFGDAATAYAKALAASPKVARDANVWCEYADALGMAQGGSLAGRPRELISHALSLDATNGKALEMAGSAAFEQNDPGAAAFHWRQLLAQLPSGSPQRRELAIAIDRAEQLAAAGSATATLSR